MRLSSFITLCGGMMLGAFAPAGAATKLPPGFPADEVHRFDELQAAFHFSPYTRAQFEQVRTMPSGRVLRSRGTFEFRQGVGMMWRTESPARTAMVISPHWLVVYGSKGQELRRTDLSRSPVARYTTIFLNGSNAEALQDLTRAFTLTCNQSAEKLVLGLQAKHEKMDLRMLMVEVVKGEVRRVEYQSARQGHTLIQFNAVENAQQVPAEPFRILAR